MSYTIRARRDTAANWASNNPILNEGEFGFAVDTNTLKMGDGVNAWLALPDIAATGGVPTLLEVLTSGNTATSSTMQVEQVTADVITGDLQANFGEIYLKPYGQVSLIVDSSTLSTSQGWITLDYQAQSNAVVGVRANVSNQAGTYTHAQFNWNPATDTWNIQGANHQWQLPVSDLDLSQRVLTNLSISTDTIQDGAVTSNKITTGELITLSAQIRDDTVTTDIIQDGAVTVAKLHSGISTNDITEGNVNLYHTPARVNTLIENYSGSFAPANVSLTQFTETLTTDTNVSGAVTLDVTAATIHDLTLTGDITSLTLSGVTQGTSATLIMRQDATGSRTLTSGAGWLWSGGVNTLSTAANAVDIISLFSDGTNIYASLTTDYQA